MLLYQGSYKYRKRGRGAAVNEHGRPAGLKESIHDRLGLGLVQMSACSVHQYI